MKKILALLLIAVLALGGAVLMLPAGETGEAVPAEETAAPETAADTAPDFTVYDLEGNAVKLSDFFGKPIVLNFWASWCGPCKMEMPDFEAKYRELGDKVTFLMVNMTAGSETVESAWEYVSSQGYSFPVLYDKALNAAETYRVNAIPATYFIDAQGCLVTAARGAINAQVLQLGIDLILE